MADGDPLVLGFGNGSSGETQLTRNGSASNPALVVVNSNGEGIYGAGTSGGIHGNSVAGVGVAGTSASQPGVYGSSNASQGVYGSAPTTGVYGTSSMSDGYGVHGVAYNVGVRGHGATGVKGTSTTTSPDFGAAVWGQGGLGAGVLGDSEQSSGVHGVSRNGVGVSGLARRNAGVQGVSTDAPGVAGFALVGPGPGVSGIGTTAAGVRGQSEFSFGVDGISQNFVGVRGHSNSRHGVVGSTNTGFAGSFIGPVIIWGSLTVTGSPKSAVVPHPDGSHRRLYCMESPESWFEDFGWAELVDGRAEVSLDPDFAQIVQSNDYHVFLTPYGDSNGLFIARQDSVGFEVREQGDGARSLRLSYRVVARRADVDAPRLERIADAEPPRFELPPPADIPSLDGPRMPSVEPEDLPQPPFIPPHPADPGTDAAFR